MGIIIRRHKLNLRQQLDVALRFYYWLKTGENLKEGIEIVDEKPVQVWYDLNFKEEKPTKI